MGTCADDFWTKKESPEVVEAAPGGTSGVCPKMSAAGWLVVGAGADSLGVESPAKLNGFFSFGPWPATGNLKGDESAVAVDPPKTDVVVLGGCSDAVVLKGLAEPEASKPTLPKEGGLPKVARKGAGPAGAPKLPEVGCVPKPNPVLG